MRFLVLAALLAIGCTNDYGAFRFPRTDAGVADADAADGGADADAR